MPAKKYIVTLTEDEREILKDIINRGKHSGWCCTMYDAIE